MTVTLRGDSLARITRCPIVVVNTGSTVAKATSRTTGVLLWTTVRNSAKPSARMIRESPTAAVTRNVPRPSERVRIPVRATRTSADNTGAPLVLPSTVPYTEPVPPPCARAGPPDTTASNSAQHSSSIRRDIAVRRPSLIECGRNEWSESPRHQCCCSSR